MSMAICEERDDLKHTYALATIEYVAQVARTNIAACSPGDVQQFIEEEKKLDQVHKKYVEAMRALLKHRQEHGC